MLFEPLFRNLSVVIGSPSDENDGVVLAERPYFSRDFRDWKVAVHSLKELAPFLAPSFDMMSTVSNVGERTVNIDNNCLMIPVRPSPSLERFICKKLANG